MEDQEVYQKVKAANLALAQYIRKGKKGKFDELIVEEQEELFEKAHVLNSSGKICDCCNGTGRKSI